MKRYSIQGTEIVKRKPLIESLSKNITRFKDLSIDLEEEFEVFKRASMDSSGNSALGSGIT